MHMYIYYIKLNNMIVKNCYPMPKIDYPFNQLLGGTIFSMIDLRSYHQLRISTGNILKTPFRTQYGYYEFLVMSFELTNVSSSFIELMTLVFKLYHHFFITMFINDILIYSWRRSDLRILFHTLRYKWLCAKFSKLEFWLECVEFLGHVVSNNKIRVDLAKI